MCRNGRGYPPFVPPHAMRPDALLSQQRLVHYVHTGKPTGMAVSQGVIRYQTRLIRTPRQIRYHSQLCDHRRSGQPSTSIRSMSLGGCPVSRRRQLTSPLPRPPKRPDAPRMIYASAPGYCLVGEIPPPGGGGGFRDGWVG